MAGIGAAAIVLSTASTGIAEQGAPQGWMGVTMGTSPGVAGVKVQHVVHGSPAESAGVQAGDVLLLVDGRTVATPADVVGALRRHGVGDAVPVAWSRDGRRLTAGVVLASFPAPDALLRMDFVGRAAPEWDGIEGVRGAPTRLRSLRGEVVLIEFWATWCGPCREIAPVLDRWQGSYGPQGLRVVGIGADPPDVVSRFGQDEGLHYPLVSDSRAATASAYGVSALPTLFVVDRRGVVRDVVVGSLGDRASRVEGMVGALLLEPAPSP